MEMHVRTAGPALKVNACLWLLLAFVTASVGAATTVYAQDCAQCAAAAVPDPPLPTGLWLLTKQVTEVDVLFIAGHKGNSVGDLSLNDVSVQDDDKPPAAILGLRNERELRLRVGVAIDTSSSVTSRFRFEQAAASEFFHQIIKQPGDLGFVMGFENHVRVTQDFVGDPNLLSQGVERLTVGGGTALYDAVRIACQKMVHREEQDMVARILVVLSDGQSNAGEATLQNAIDAAQEADVIVYTISTNYRLFEDPAQQGSMDQGNYILHKLAEQTGGRMLKPANPQDVAKSFAKIGEELRSRYAISYKPADFNPDGHYRKIKIEARKMGDKLEVRARRGYFARAASSLVTPSSVEDSSAVTDLR